MCKPRQLHYAQAAQQIALSVSSSLLAGKQQSSQTQDVHSEHRKDICITMWQHALPFLATWASMTFFPDQ
jgi:hypothetical protein